MSLKKAWRKGLPFFCGVAGGLQESFLQLVELEREP